MYMAMVAILELMKNYLAIKNASKPELPCRFDGATALPVATGGNRSTVAK